MRNEIPRFNNYQERREEAVLFIEQLLTNPQTYSRVEKEQTQMWQGLSTHFVEFEKGIKVLQEFSPKIREILDDKEDASGNLENFYPEKMNFIIRTFCESYPNLAPYLLIESIKLVQSDKSKNKSQYAVSFLDFLRIAIEISNKN